MILILVRKLLRDLRLPLGIMAILLMLFQVLWAKVTQRIVGEVLLQFTRLGIDIATLRAIIFQESGKIIQTLMGGENIAIERALDMMSISYVHPLTQTIVSVWALGRAAGALAGELDRGTLELLLAQPLRRSQVVLAHFIVDLIAIPVLALSMWMGTVIGVHSFGLSDPGRGSLYVDVMRFLPALASVAGLAFALGGFTMIWSALGRQRGRVLGLVVLLVLLQFLVNVIGQLWTPMAGLRPWTIFYHYQPQTIILNGPTSESWRHVAVLAGVGLGGYGFALGYFCHRDLPAPL